MVIVTLLHPTQPTPLQEWRFDSERIIRVGRATGNQVVIHSGWVSRYHVELRAVSTNRCDPSTPLRRWCLVNVSTNGTYLNGTRISQAMLTSNDVIQLAQHGPRLRVHLPPGAPLSSHQPIPTMRAVAAPANEQNLSSACSHQGNVPNNRFCIHCGQPLQIQKVIRHYRILQTLGRGGMGTTYLAWHPVAHASDAASLKGRLLVLKEMNADVARLAKAQELFEREARVLKALNHPGIPKFYDFFIEADKKYLGMELIHGQDLECYVRQHGPVSPPQAIQWMIQVCAVLQYLHTRTIPVIHRDIKPNNLMVRTLDQRIVLLDFGAVTAQGRPFGTRIGAEGFSAPEQMRGQPVPQSDLYAVGASLVFLLTGKNPRHFYAKTEQPYRFDLHNCREIPPRLRQVVERATHPHVNKRYPNAQALSHALSSESAN